MHLSIVNFVKIDWYFVANVSKNDGFLVKKWCICAVFAQLPVVANFKKIWV